MGVFNSNIPYYKIVPSQQLVQPTVEEEPYIDDIFDPVFNARVKNALRQKYGNPVLGTAMGYLDLLDNTFIPKDNKWGILGSGMGVLSTFGRSMDKADDFLLGGLTEAVKGVTGQGIQNPLENIFEKDEDYTGKRLLAAMANGMASIAGKDARIQESDLKGMWNVVGTGIDLATDPGILGGNLAKKLAPQAKKLSSREILDQLGKAGAKSTVGEVGQLMSNYDDFMAKIAGNATLPGILPLAKKLRYKIADLLGTEKYNNMVDVDLNTPEGVEQALKMQDDVRQNPVAEQLIQMDDQIEEAVQNAAAKEAASEAVQKAPVEAEPAASVEDFFDTEDGKNLLKDVEEVDLSNLRSREFYDKESALYDSKHVVQAINQRIDREKNAIYKVRRSKLKQWLGRNGLSGTKLMNLSNEEFDKVRQKIIDSKAFPPDELNKMFLDNDMSDMKHMRARIQDIRRIYTRNPIKDADVIMQANRFADDAQTALNDSVSKYNASLNDYLSKNKDFADTNVSTVIGNGLDEVTDDVATAAELAEDEYGYTVASELEDMRDYLQNSDYADDISIFGDSLDEVSNENLYYAYRYGNFTDDDALNKRIAKDIDENVPLYYTRYCDVYDYSNNVDLRLIRDSADEVNEEIRDTVNSFKEALKEAVKGDESFNFGNTPQEIEDLLDIEDPDELLTKLYTRNLLSHSTSNERLLDKLDDVINGITESHNSAVFKLRPSIWRSPELAGNMVKASQAKLDKFFIECKTKGLLPDDVNDVSSLIKYLEHDDTIKAMLSNGDKNFRIKGLWNMSLPGKKNGKRQDSKDYISSVKEFVDSILANSKKKAEMLPLKSFADGGDEIYDSAGSVIGYGEKTAKSSESNPFKYVNDVDNAAYKEALLSFRKMNNKELVAMLQGSSMFPDKKLSAAQIRRHIKSELDRIAVEEADSHSKMLYDKLIDLAEDLDNNVLAVMRKDTTNAAYAASDVLNKYIAQHTKDFTDVQSVMDFVKDYQDWFEVVPESVSRHLYQKELDALPRVVEQLSKAEKGHIWTTPFKLPGDDTLYSLTGKAKDTVSLKEKDPILYGFLNSAIVSDSGEKVTKKGVFRNNLDARRIKEILGADSVRTAIRTGNVSRVQNALKGYLPDIEKFMSNYTADAIFKSKFGHVPYSADEYLISLKYVYPYNNYQMIFELLKTEGKEGFEKACAYWITSDLKNKDATLSNIKQVLQKRLAPLMSPPLAQKYVASIDFGNAFKAPDGIEQYLKYSYNKYTKQFEVPNLNRLAEANDMLVDAGLAKKEYIYEKPSKISKAADASKTVSKTLEQTEVQKPVQTVEELAEKEIAATASTEELAKTVYAPKSPVDQKVDEVLQDTVPEMSDPGIPGNTPEEKRPYMSPESRRWSDLVADNRAIKSRNQAGDYATLRVKRYKEIVDKAHDLTSKVDSKEVRKVMYARDYADGDTVLGKNFLQEMVNSKAMFTRLKPGAEATAIEKALRNNAEQINSAIGSELITVRKLKGDDGFVSIGCFFNPKDAKKKYVSIHRNFKKLKGLQLEDVVFESAHGTDVLNKILASNPNLSEANDVLDNLRQITDDYATLLGHSYQSSAHYYKHTMLPDDKATAEWSQKYVYGGLDLDEIENFGNSLATLPEFDSILHGTFRTTNPGRRLRGGAYRFADDAVGIHVFSDDIESVARGTLTSGMLGDLNTQCYTDLFVNDNFNIHTYARTTDDLKRVLFPETPDGKLSGNATNTLLIAPRKNAAGKLVGFTRFDKFSEKGLQQALNNPDTILVPYGIAEHLDRLCRKSAKMSNKVYAFIHKYLTVPFKFGVLLNPGFLLGNFNDAVLKNATSMSEKYGTDLTTELANMMDSMRQVDVINEAFDNAYQKILKDLKSNGYKLQPTDVLSGSVEQSRRLRGWINNYIDGTLASKSGGHVKCNLSSEEINNVRLYMFLNGIQSTAGNANYQDLGDLADGVRKSKYDFSLNPVERIMYGEGEYDPKKLTSQGVFLNNVLSQKLLSSSDWIERHARAGCVLNDLKHAGYDSKTLAEALGIPRMLDVDAYRKLHMAADNALHASNASNFNYDAMTDTLDAVATVVPFPTFYMKNLGYWLDILLDHPQYIDNAISFQQGMWESYDTEDDQFQAEAKGRGAIPFGRDASNMKGIFKPTSLNSLFSAFHTMQNPIGDTVQRLHPLLGGGINLATSYIDNPVLDKIVQTNRDEVKYRPYNTNPYQKNLTADSPDFNPLAYMFHKFNPYDRFLKTAPRIPRRIKQGDAQPADFLPSVFQPMFSKKS